MVRTLVGGLVGVLLLVGCSAPAGRQASPTTRSANAASTTQPAAAQRADRLTVNDPCPSRLHDLAGPLLVYLTTHYRLPERLDELRQMPGGERLGDFACPTSGRPYLYNPAGVVGANVSRRAVIYDAAPTHDGYRWAIVIREATPNAPFIAEVVAWSEGRFPKGSGFGVQGSGAAESFSSPEP